MNHVNLKHAVWWIGLSCLALVLFGLFATPIAGQSSVATPPPGLEGYDLPYLPATTTAEKAKEATGEGPTLPEQSSEWTVFAFQAFHEDNWDIYYRNDSPYGFTNRLTTDPAPDIHPRLDRYCDRIVFASGRTGNYDIFVMNTDGTGLTQLTTDPATDIYPAWSPNGTRIVFESYRGGSANVYVMDADGSNQQQLTSERSYEGQPVWSPDGSRIAYVSHVTGNNRIFVMNLDGSGKTQLSGQRNSQNPAWSPDGSLIAYDADADKDGWQELWLMNADGSNQGEIYDIGVQGRHAWVGSFYPDGSRLTYTHIHYIEYEGNWYWTESSLRYRQFTHPDWTGYLPDVGDVSWRPDMGTLDAWPPISSISDLPPISSATFRVSWSGVDEGKSGLQNYDVQVREAGMTDWTDWRTETNGTSALFTGVGGHTYEFRCRARDWAGYVEDWPTEPDTQTTVEALPPQSTMEPLPDYAPNGVTVRWIGEDLGGSGIGHFDIEVKDKADGIWSTWLGGAIEMAAGFAGTPGHTYCFRSRATDLAQNVEHWPDEDGDTCTSIYAWGISGTVTDHTGVPVTEVTVTTQPPEWKTMAGNQEGGYAVYLATTDDENSVSWHKPGYGGLPLTRFDGQLDAHLDVVLPPADDVIRDGSFEEGDLDSNWVAVGPISHTVSRSQGHTGYRALMLGNWPQQLAVIQSLDAGPQYYSVPQIVADSDGALHAAWAHNTNDVYEICYVLHKPGGDWSHMEHIVGSKTAPTRKPQLRVDTQGQAHLVWRTTSHLFYALRSADGTWSKPVVVSTFKTSDDDIGYSMHLTPDGTLHLAWLDDWHSPDPAGIYYTQRRPDGNWLERVLVSDMPATDLQIEVTEKGIVHLVWIYGSHAGVYHARRDLDGIWTEQCVWSDWSKWVRSVLGDDEILHITWSGRTPESIKLYYAQRAADGNWSSPQIIYGIGTQTVQNISLIQDRYGALHSFMYNGWLTPSAVFHGHQDHGGTWSDLASVSQGTEKPDDAQCYYGRNERLQMAWTCGEYTFSNLCHAYWGDDGSWSTPEVLYVPNRTEEVHITTTPDGNSHALLINKNSTAQTMFYAGPAPSHQTLDSVLSQSITLPDTASGLALSFLYQLEGGAPQARPKLIIEIDNGLSVSPLYTTTTTTENWCHRWVDVSPWEGQTVTISLRLHQEAGVPMGWAYLDEISLGAMHPDLWVEMSTSKPVVQPGDMVRLTIVRRNRGFAGSSTSTMTVTMPAELELVESTAPPAATSPSLCWNASELSPGASDTLVLTTVVSTLSQQLNNLILQVDLGTSMGELETANNMAQTRIFVGHRTSLPTILR